MWFQIIVKPVKPLSHCKTLKNWKNTVILFRNLWYFWNKIVHKHTQNEGWTNAMDKNAWGNKWRKIIKQVDSNVQMKCFCGFLNFYLSFSHLFQLYELFWATKNIFSLVLPSHWIFICEQNKCPKCFRSDLFVFANFTLARYFSSCCCAV